MVKNIIEKIIETPFDIVEGLLPRPKEKRMEERKEIHRDANHKTGDQNSSMCEYEGCKRLVEGNSNFCIFHMPSEDKERLNLWEKCMEKFYHLIKSSGGNFQGFILKDVDIAGITIKKGISFRGATFIGTSVFSMKEEDTIFENIADFRGATFNEEVYFWDATFQKEADFNLVTFRDKVDFRGTTFSGQASFTMATFNGKADFGGAKFLGHSSFGRSIFSNEAMFGEAVFSGEASFNRDIFLDQAFFGRATFFREALFGETIFTGEADFNNVTFSGEADFSRVNFKGNAYFIESNFEEKSNFRRTILSGEAIFRRATFTDQAFFIGSIFKDGGSFDDCTGLNGLPPKMIFSDSRIQYVSFNNVILNNIAFDGAKMEFTYLADAKWGMKEKPGFRNLLPIENVDYVMIEEHEVPDSKGEKRESALKIAEGTYRRIKYSLTNEGAYEKAGIFFIREREMQRKILKNSFKSKEKCKIIQMKRFQDDALTRQMSLLLFLLCLKEYLGPRIKFWRETFHYWLGGYGERPVQVLSWSGIVIAIFSIIYYIADHFLPLEGLSPSMGSMNYLYFSVVTFTTLGFGDIWPDHLYLRLITASEALIGAFLMAYFVVSWARKVMR